LKEVLEELSLVCYIKTSGKKTKSNSALKEKNLKENVFLSASRKVEKKTGF
jgi:hypothetical protein